MNISTQQIAAEISTLPEREQQEVFDFIEFLKVKLARQQSRVTGTVTGTDHGLFGPRFIRYS